MMRDWLVLDLEAPLMAFGGVAIDQVGPVRVFPSASMLTGLIANALGWDWSDRERHQHLQERLVFGAAQMRAGTRLTDMQNVQMSRSDKGWTTRGVPEGRAGDSYEHRHRRTREYHADAWVRMVMTLRPARDKDRDKPTLAEIEQALVFPARPLFLGRKPCLPTRPIVSDEGPNISAPDAHAALGRVASGVDGQWPIGEGPGVGEGRHDSEISDKRIWATGLHGGTRRVINGVIAEVV